MFPKWTVGFQFGCLHNNEMMMMMVTFKQAHFWGLAHKGDWEGQEPDLPSHPLPFPIPSLVAMQLAFLALPLVCKTLNESLLSDYDAAAAAADNDDDEDDDVYDQFMNNPLIFF